MLAFVQTQQFLDMNVGFSLDEGIASNSDMFKVFYAERCVWSKLSNSVLNHINHTIIKILKEFISNVMAQLDTDHCFIVIQLAKKFVI